MNNKYLYVFDAGHGGIKDGVYTTAPSKMKIFADGLTICEGVVNRGVATKVSKGLTALDIDHAFVHDEVADISLGERCRRVNKLVAKAVQKKVVFISLHSDAFVEEKANGVSVYTSPGQDASDPIAEVFANEVLESFPGSYFRADKVTDGDLDKEAKFYVILPGNNKAYARVLLENFFFTNRREAEFLLSEEGQQKIADYICRAIVKIENDPKL